MTALEDIPHQAAQLQQLELAARFGKGLQVSVRSAGRGT